MTTLYNFSAEGANGDNTDGAGPEAPLLLAFGDTFYGTTTEGGCFRRRYHLHAHDRRHGRRDDLQNHHQLLRHERLQPRRKPQWRSDPAAQHRPLRDDLRRRGKQHGNRLSGHHRREN